MVRPVVFTLEAFQLLGVRRPMSAWSEPAKKEDLPLHVYPVSEEKDHDLTHTWGCWCKPAIEHDANGNPAVIVHHRTEYS